MKTFPLHPVRQRDLADFLMGLKQHGARFAIVGAWAVMAHSGKVRATKDIDVYVAPDDANLLVVARALASFGAPANLCSVDALRPQPQAKFSGITFGLPPNRIDVLSKMAVGFDEIEPHVEQFDLAGEPIPVVSRSDLVALKRLALKDDPTRKTDRADLEALGAPNAAPPKKPAARSAKKRPK